MSELESENAKLKKKLATSKLNEDRYYRYWQCSKGELDQLHDVLDALPNSIPKRGEDSCQDRSVLTRLAAWLGSTK